MVATVAVQELADHLAYASMSLDGDSVPHHPVVVVDLDTWPHLPPDVEASAVAARAASAAARTTVLLIGRSVGSLAAAWDPVVASLTCTVVGRLPQSWAEIRVEDVDVAISSIVAAVGRSPRAAATLNEVLRLTQTCSVREGLVIESLAYSMLLAGGEFARWRAATPTRAVPQTRRPAVHLDREGPELRVMIDRPERRNAFGRAVRDELIAALELVHLDPSIERMVLSGAGPSFCSGGDLDEFGSSADVTTAHLIRLDRSVAARIFEDRDRIEAHLHGACIGAGIELPAFTARVVARADAYARLPELAMGLIPGAGGTVSLTKRIGRFRTAYLALTGARLDAATAHEWGLVDEIDG